MKLDSEEQRKDLLELLSTVRMVTTIGTVMETVAECRRIMNPIHQAELEPVGPDVIVDRDGNPVRPVVPIESLAPDPTPLKLEAGP